MISCYFRWLNIWLHNFFLKIKRRAFLYSCKFVEQFEYGYCHIESSLLAPSQLVSILWSAAFWITKLWSEMKMIKKQHNGHGQTKSVVACKLLVLWTQKVNDTDICFHEMKNTRINAALSIDETSDAGSRYRCGRVGRGIQPPSIPHAPHRYTITI